MKVEKTPLGSQFHDGRFHTHHFEWAASKQPTQNAGYETERRPISFRTRVFSTFAHRWAKVEKTPLGSQFHDGRFHTTAFCPGLFQAAHSKCHGMKPNVVQLRSKRVFFRLSPSMGESRKNALRIAIPRRSVSYHGISPWAFPSPGQKAGYETERRPIAIQNAFCRLSPIDGRKSKKHP